MAASPNVLIAGAGVAGGAFASCFLRAFPSARVTIVERAPTLLLTGAGIDIRSSAVDVIKWLGIESEILKHTTKEEGIQFLSNKGRNIAEFRASGRADVQSMTSEYEIFRGALAKSLLEPVLDKVKLIFDDQVESFEQDGDGVSVTFKSSEEVQKFDLFVAADGIGSRVRGAILNTKPREHIRDVGLHVAFFTIKEDLLDGSRMAKWWNTTRRRSLFLRPDPNPAGRTRGHIATYIPKDDLILKERFEIALQEGHESYKKLLEELYADAGWITPRVLKGMRESDDFYCSFFATVRSPKLQQGRVALLGDAGFATPGIGTSLAIIGGYVLAGEILRSPNDYSLALKRYEELMQPFVHSQDTNSLGAIMTLVHPESEWGLAVRNFILGTISILGIDRLFFTLAGYFGFTEKKIQFPDYPWPKQSA